MGKSSLYPNISTVYPDLADVPAAAEFLISVAGRNLNATPAQMSQLLGFASGEAYVDAIDEELGSTDWRETGDVDLSAYAPIEYVDAQIAAVVAGAMPLDADNPPAEGDPLVLGPGNSAAKGDVIDIIAANAPYVLTYANPLVIDLGPFPEHTCYKVTLSGNLTIDDLLGTSETIKPGFAFELIVVNDASRTLAAVPAEWTNRQTSVPALATGNGAQTSIFVTIRSLSPLKVDYLVVPGANI